MKFWGEFVAACWTVVVPLLLWTVIIVLLFAFGYRDLQFVSMLGTMTILTANLVYIAVRPNR